MRIQRSVAPSGVWPTNFSWNRRRTKSCSPFLFDSSTRKVKVNLQTHLRTDKHMHYILGVLLHESVAYVSLFSNIQCQIQGPITKPMALLNHEVHEPRYSIA